MCDKNFIMYCDLPRRVTISNNISTDSVVGLLSLETNDANLGIIEYTGTYDNNSCILHISCGNWNISLNGNSYHKIEGDRTLPYGKYSCHLGIVDFIVKR